MWDTVWQIHICMKSELSWVSEGLCDGERLGFSTGTTCSLLCEGISKETLLESGRGFGLG